MSWTQGPLRWPASTASLHSRAQGVLGQLPATQASAMGRLQGLAARAQYRRHPLSAAAAALASLRSDLDQLLVTGAPGLHFYSLNQADAVLAIAENLNLGSN